MLTFKLNNEPTNDLLQVQKHSVWNLCQIGKRLNNTNSIKLIIMKKYILTIIGIILFISVHAEERYIVTSDNVKLYVNVKGKGTPCLYIHGGPGSGSFWLERFFGDYLEQNFQMVYLDQRGVSRSSSPEDGNYSMDRMLKDFEEVRVALGIDQWITLGHSFGGILQMGYAENYPDANAGMIMVNATINIKKSICESWIPKASEFLGTEKIAPCSDEYTQVFESVSDLIGKLNEQGIMWKMGYANQENEIEMNSTFAEIPNWNWDFGARAMAMKDYWTDYTKSTSVIKIPVLFFYGKTDWMIGPDHYKDAHFPNIILWSSNVGHMPFMENKPDLKKAINSYIEKYNF